jgi:ABC-2 type transport system permease protein
MFSTFFFKEISTGLKRPMVYIFLLIITLLIFIGVVSEISALGGDVGSVLKNSPHIFAIYTSKLSIFGLLIATAYFNNAALRDYQTNFNEIIFSVPINKAGYFFGRFFGALILSTVPLLGVFIGFLLGTTIGPATGWVDASRMGGIHFSTILNNYLLFILPNMFFAGAITFAMAIKWKSTIISFVASLIIIIAYMVSGTFLSDLSNQTLAGLTDIFGIRAYQIDSKYFTIAEKNISGATFSGLLLQNRIIWVITCSLILISSYFSFSFIRQQKKYKKKKVDQKANVDRITFPKPNVTSEFNLGTTISQFASFFKISFYSIVHSTTFKILFLFGAIILITTLLNSFEYYGLQSYPVTYKMMNATKFISYILLFIIVVFFSGELIWAERSSNISGVIDATPHNSFVMLMAKSSSLLVLVVLLNLFFLIVSIGFQLANGYTHIELGIYLQDFCYSTLPNNIIWASLLIGVQVIVNHKYLGHFVSIILLLLSESIMDAFGILSEMINLGNAPLYNYSDMSGFGAGLPSTLWFGLYWMLFGILLLGFAGTINVRGTSLSFIKRVKSAKLNMTRGQSLVLVVIACLFLTTTGIVYYNTQVLNDYVSPGTLQTIQAEYEKKYKVYEGAIQPKIIDAKYVVDIYPEERDFKAKTSIIVKNKSSQAIDSLHFTFLKVPWHEIMVNAKWEIDLNIQNAKLVLDDTDIGYQIFKLQTPMAPNDSITIEITAAYISEGFENSVSNVRVASNGTFVDHFSIMPAFGYNPLNELSDVNDRKSHGLPPKSRMSKLKENSKQRMVNYVSRGESDWVNGETIISTSLDQMAIAPGTLIKEWQHNGRNYYHYKSDHSTLHYFNFMSARYEVARKKWNGIDIEVYYDKAHAYNIDMMIKAVEKSLKYFTANFGPYYHKQARIIEFPNFLEFAEAFPGTMPYSEAYGFLVNLEDENDNNIIESVIAHEMAHQWWAHQVVGANMQGASMLSESFSEYSALMVMKKSSKTDRKMKHYLQYDFEKYLTGRTREVSKELPLYKVEDQGYIHYGKGSLIMYALQDYIGEEKVNNALKSFLEEFRYKEPPYPTSLDFLKHLEPHVPDSLNYLITDWFKEITLYDYRVKKASYSSKENGKFEVSINIEAHKIKADTIGTETEVGLNDWVDIAVYDDSDEETMIYNKRVLLTDNDMTFKFEVETLPVKAAIDPKRLLIERVITDNTLTIEKKIN